MGAARPTPTVQEGLSTDPTRSVPPSVQPRPETALCNDCQALSLQQLTREQVLNGKVEKYGLDYVRHDTLPSLPRLAETSASTGCIFCHFLREAILSSLEGFILEELRCEPDQVPVEIGDVKFEFGGADSLTIGFQFQDRASNSITLDIAADPGACVDCFGMERRHVPAELFSDLGLRNVQSLLDKAIASSPPPLEVPEIPTRLIDVGGRLDQGEPRLIVTSELASLRDSDPADVDQRRYVALSYCWGDVQDQKNFLKTETKTLSGWKQQIPLQLFPATLRDAVLMTRQLGIRYIWIDALCIVQDDELDWRFEAARMAGVYQNAYLTICALQDSCANGFSHRPTPTIEIPFASHLAPAVTGSYHILPLSNSLGVGSPGCPFFSKWITRGWTFQELQFSSRALLFGKAQTHLYTCITSSHGESEGRFFPENGHTYWAQGTLRSVWRFDNDTNVYDVWYRAVEDYADRNLTFSKDRLTAISGLASDLTARFPSLKGQYAAGLWAPDLCSDTSAGLLWVRRTNSQHLAPTFDEYLARCLSSTDQYLAPSWSWASHDEGVFFQATGPEFAPLATVDSVRVDAESDVNPYGCVRPGGYMLLSGWIARIPTAYFQNYFTTLLEPNAPSRCTRTDRTLPAGCSAMDLLSGPAGPGTGQASVELDWWVEDARHAEYWPDGMLTVLLCGLRVYPPELKRATRRENWELFMNVRSGLNEDEWWVHRNQVDGGVLALDSMYVNGIVLHETGREGEYLRAGFFNGTALHDDSLKELREAEWRTVKVV